MANLREALLGPLTAVADGTAFNIADLKDVYVFVYGTFVGTWKVQISFDQGTTWADWDTGTAGKLTAVLPPAGRVRFICTAFTSGTLRAAYGGRRAG